MKRAVIYVLIDMSFCIHRLLTTAKGSTEIWAFWLVSRQEEKGALKCQSSLGKIQMYKWGRNNKVSTTVRGSFSLWLERQMPKQVAHRHHWSVFCVTERALSVPFLLVPFLFLSLSLTQLAFFFHSLTLFVNLDAMEEQGPVIISPLPIRPTTTPCILDRSVSTLLFFISDERGEAVLTWIRIQQ